MGSLVEFLPSLPTSGRLLYIVTIFSEFLLSVLWAIFPLFVPGTFCNLLWLKVTLLNGERAEFWLACHWWSYRAGGQSTFSLQTPFMPMIQHMVTVRIRQLPFGPPKKLISLTLFIVTYYPVRVGPWRRLSAKEVLLSHHDGGEDSWESLRQQGNQSVLKEINPEYSLEGLLLTLQYFGHMMGRITHWKRPWCWERLRSEEADDRGWDGWVASLTQWTLVWANSGR